MLWSRGEAPAVVVVHGVCGATVAGPAGWSWVEYEGMSMR